MATEARERQRKIGHNVRWLARREGIKLRDIAAQMQWSEGKMHGRLSGQQALTVEELIDLAAILHVGLFDLLEGIEMADDQRNPHIVWTRDFAGSDVEQLDLPFEECASALFESAAA